MSTYDPTFDYCPVDLDIWGAPDLSYDFAAASALAAAARHAADAVASQQSSHVSYLQNATKDFAGYFSELFSHNAQVAFGDAAELGIRLREIAQFIGRLSEAARQENARRQRAREWKARVEARRANWLDRTWDDIFGAEPPPREHAVAAPVFFVMPLAQGERRHPVRGGGSGTSSARPSNLRTYASNTAALNDALSHHPGAIESTAATFMASCDFGSIDVAPVVRGFRNWLAANAEDVSWANYIAQAFEDAGAGDGIGSLPDSALEAALAAAGVSMTREDLVIDPATAVGAMPTTGYAMDPVNTSTGNFLEPESDVRFSQGSASLGLTRMYNSLSDAGGVFGPGWASTLDMVLLLDDDGGRLVQADGRHVVFPRSGEGFERGVGENFWLAEEPGDMLPGASHTGRLLVVRDNRGSWWAFTRSGAWLGMGGEPGATVMAERNEDGQIARLRHERGRFIDIDYQDGLVAVAQVSDGRRIEYAYQDGLLVTVSDGVGARRYRWNEAGLIDQVTSASGVVECENTYDEKRRVVSQLTQHGRVVRFAYLSGRVTSVADEDGAHGNTWIADRKGRLVGVVDAEQRRQSLAYDPHGNLVSVTERDGSVTVHGYDARGRRIRTVTPAGADLTYGYDDHDRLTTVVSELGGITEYEYADDADRNPSVILEPEGGRTELSWRTGLLARIVNPVGVAVEIDYDEHGDMIAVRNAVGDTARIERDQAGRPTAMLTPLGHRMRFRYDRAGLMVSREEPDGAVWRFEYGAGGRVQAVIDPLGARTETEYGTNGEASRTIDPLGRVTQRVSDQFGNIEQVVLPDGASWGFVHDALSRLRQITDPQGGIWAREYDVNGNVAAVIDPTGIREASNVTTTTGVSVLRSAFETVTVTSDAFGRPIRRETTDGSTELTAYDRCGRPVELVDANGGLTKIERDAAGQIVQITSPEGRVTQYEYDSCGRPCAAINAAGARMTLSYDADSRVVARTLPTGETVQLEYDSASRVTREVIPGSGVARYGYDKAGRVVFCQNTQYGIRRFRYDMAGQLVAAINGVGGVTRYEYDERGRVTRITDPLGGVTERSYTHLDSLSRQVDPLGRVTEASYDAAGRQLTQTDADGQVTRWEYDQAGQECGMLIDGRRISRIARDVRARTTIITDYTADERSPVTHTIRADRLGRMIERTSSDETMRWEYDRDGNRTAMIAPDGTRTDYLRDAVGRVTRIEHTAFGTATLRYDASGRVVEAVAGDRTDTWAYENGFPSEHVISGTQGVTRTRVVRDDEGRIARISGPEGVVEYGYDDACQLTLLRTSAGQTRSWEYDLAGRLIRERHDDLGLDYAYDAAGQLLTRTGKDGATLYTYDELGRRVGESCGDRAVEYRWDKTGWLEQVVTTTPDAEQSVTLKTNVLGEVTEAGGQRLHWDAASAVPTLVAVGGTSVAHGPAGLVGAGDSWTASGWRTGRATHSDDPWAVLGSVSAAQGAHQAETSPGLFPAGVGLTASGGLSVGGLEFMGARAYDPASKGFLSVDPLDPVAGAGWSGNPYAYAGNDPLHQVDPTGLRPVTDAELARYTEQTQGWLKDAGQNIGDWWNDNWEYVVGSTLTVVGAIAVIAGIVVCFTGVGAPLGIAISAAGGYLFDFGLNINEHKRETGSVDWGKAAGDAVISGIIGGIIGGAVGKILKIAWKLLKPVFTTVPNPKPKPKLDDKPTSPEAPTPRLDVDDINFSAQQIQKKFKHAEDFGITGTYNRANAAALEQAIIDHMKNPATQIIEGTYRGTQNVTHYFNPHTGLNVMVRDGEFLSGWKLSIDQIRNMLERGAL